MNVVQFSNKSGMCTCSVHVVYKMNPFLTMVEVAPLKTEAVVSLIEQPQVLWHGAQVHLDQGTKGTHTQGEHLDTRFWWVVITSPSPSL